MTLVAHGSLTVLNLVDKTTLSGQPNEHPFVKRMESKPGFEENAKSLPSQYYPLTPHTGYTSLVHGGILAALVEEGCVEYCNRDSLNFYQLTVIPVVHANALSILCQAAAKRTTVSRIYSHMERWNFA